MRKVGCVNTCFNLNCFVWRSTVIHIVGIYVYVVQAFICHDDPTFEMESGTLGVVQFTWLAALQYIHIQNGRPNYFRVPRVVLISQEFVLSTAYDAANVPDGYALGNVVFGDYERDEHECGITEEQVSEGAQCDPSVLVVPIADVVVHPEYKPHGVRDSLAVIQLSVSLGSEYMVPVCLPLKDDPWPDEPERYYEGFYHIDFISDVPRDFSMEEKESIKIKLLPRDKCYELYSRVKNVSHPTRACSEGCGYRSGSPTIIHEKTGHFTVVAISQETNDIAQGKHLRRKLLHVLQVPEGNIEMHSYIPSARYPGPGISLVPVAGGGSRCPDPRDVYGEHKMSLHTLVAPYVQWITKSIMGNSTAGLRESDPFGSMIPMALSQRRFYTGANNYGDGWVGKWWMGGFRCYDRGVSALFRFYQEVFEVDPLKREETRLNFYVDLYAPTDVRVVCVKVGVPFRLGKPRVFNLDTSYVKLLVSLRKFNVPYFFEVEAWGLNSTYEPATSPKPDVKDLDDYKDAYD